MTGRCPRCYAARCFCHAIRPVESRLSIVIVRHRLERHRPSNTARLAALALGCPVLDYPPPDPRLIAGDDVWLLYPEGDVALPPRPPARLIVLDGTWQQTRRMRQRAFRNLPIWRLPAPPSRPRLRRPSRPDGMSTLEAIAAAVALVDGRDAAGRLESLLEAAVAAHAAQVNRGASTGC